MSRVILLFSSIFLLPAVGFAASPSQTLWPGAPAPGPHWVRNTCCHHHYWLSDGSVCVGVRCSNQQFPTLAVSSRDTVTHWLFVAPPLLLLWLVRFQQTTTQAYFESHNALEADFPCHCRLSGRSPWEQLATWAARVDLLKSWSALKIKLNLTWIEFDLNWTLW